MAENFTYYSPTEVVFGTETHKETGNYVRKYQGSKVLVVYGSGHAVKSGLIGEVTESLKNAGVEYELLGGVVPNPHLSKVYEGIEVGKRIKADFLLAVGGGSVIDTAKAIAYGLAEPEKDVWTLFEHVRKAESCLPVASVLTIPSEICYYESGADTVSFRLSDREWVCRYPDAYDGTLFYRRRYHGIDGCHCRRTDAHGHEICEDSS